MSADIVYLIPGGEDTDFKVEVPVRAAMQSELIKSMLQDDDDGETPVVPIQEVSKDILLKVVEFLVKHMDDPMREIFKPIQSNNMKDLVGEWDAEFIDLEQETLFRVILAANFLDIPALLDLGIAKVATMIRGKEPEEVKKIFNISEDITPEEEKKVRDENPWIFDVAQSTTKVAQNTHE